MLFDFMLEIKVWNTHRKLILLTSCHRDIYTHDALSYLTGLLSQVDPVLLGAAGLEQQLVSYL